VCTMAPFSLHWPVFLFRAGQLHFLFPTPDAAELTLAHQVGLTSCGTLCSFFPMFKLKDICTCAPWPHFHFTGLFFSFEPVSSTFYFPPQTPRNSPLPHCVNFLFWPFYKTFFINKLLGKLFSYLNQSTGR
jgi:hypothetical protein